MKHSKLMKLVLFLMAATLASAAFAGCGGGSASSEVSQASVVSTAEPAGAESEAPIPLNIALLTHPNVQDFDTNYFTLKTEKENNIDITFTLLPSGLDDAKTKLSLMVSSNAILPDVLNIYGLQENIIYDYGSRGIILNLNDYYADPELSKNFNAISDEDKDFILKNMKSADGNIYSVARYNPWPWNTGNKRGWINITWLNTLELDIPKTTDEFYEVLKAFAGNDPNGNGKKDEIGMVGSKDGWSQSPVDYIMNAFIYANADKNYLNVENGTLIPAYMQDEWRQGLEFMNRLVNEGLLSPLSFTQDQTQLKALINVPGGMAGFVPAGSASTFTMDGVYDDMELIAPLTGPDGIQYTAYNPALPEKTWLITKDCQNPEKAYALGDYFLGYMPSMEGRYGEYGVEWDDAAESANWVNEFGKTSTWRNIVAKTGWWGQPQNKNWGDRQPSYRSLELSYGEGRYDKDNPPEGVDLTKSPVDELYARYYPQCFPEEYIAQLLYTPEESEAIATSSTAINAYVKEMTAAFITGSRPLSDWDSYKAEIEKMGLEEYLKITQAAFDRSK